MNFSLLSFPFQTERLTGSMDARRLCRIASYNGIEELDLMTTEIRLYGVKALRAAFSESGVKCGCVIAALPFYRSVDSFPKKLDAALRDCEALGADKLMVVPGEMDARECSLLRREELIRRAIELYTICVERGRERGIEIMFEDTPQPQKPLSSAADCRRVLDAVPGLGFVFDTANFMVGEEQPDLLKDYDLLRDRIRRVHLKDVVRGKFKNGEKCENGDFIRCVTTGSGIVPLRPFVERLVSDGFGGSVCIEYASGSGIRGDLHSKYLSVYVKIIRSYIEGKVIAPPYGEIPGVNKPVSRIFFGTAFKTMMSGGNANALLDAALALGINAFDCARGYGLAEKSLGNWIKERGNRERVVILSKCGNVSPTGAVKVNRAVILRELEASLRALGTDYIDVYLLHRDDPNTPVSELIDTLNEVKAAGKIRSFGVSNWTHERIAEANSYAGSRGLEGFAVSSPNFGLTRQMSDPWGGGCVTVSGPENAAARSWYRECDMPVIAYSSLGHGFMSGKFRSGDYEAAKKLLDAPSRRAYLCEENMLRLRNAETLAEKYKTAVPDIAMRYVFGADMNVFAVMSTTNPARLPGNVRAANSPLSEEDVKLLEDESAQ